MICNQKNHVGHCSEVVGHSLQILLSRNRKLVAEDTAKTNQWQKGLGGEEAV